MSTKKALAAVVTEAVLLFFSLFFVWRPFSVSAQCGNPQPSSCITCHTKEYPVTDKGAWHSIHASKDICVNCHGGNVSTMDKNLAHESMLSQPLSDIYTDCHHCHPDYIERAVPFAATLQITPSGCATPTPVAVSNVSSGLPPNGIVMPSGSVSTFSPFQSSLLILGGLALMVFFCISACWLGEHRVKD